MRIFDVTPPPDEWAPEPNPRERFEDEFTGVAIEVIAPVEEDQQCLICVYDGPQKLLLSPLNAIMLIKLIEAARRKYGHRWGV